MEVEIYNRLHKDEYIQKKTRVASILFILGMIAGIVSVVHAIDSSDYFIEVAEKANQVISVAKNCSYRE